MPPGPFLFRISLLFAMVAMVWPVYAQEYSLQRGDWRAWLDSPGGELPFHLHIEGDDDLRGWIRNGEEQIDLSDVRWEGRSLVLEFAGYDALLRTRLTADGSGMDGLWKRRLGPTEFAALRFHATFGYASRFLSMDESISELDGANQESATSKDELPVRWHVVMGDYDVPSVAELRVDPTGRVRGTMINSSGDYRYMEGSFEAGTLRLSRFDGAHAFLVTAKRREDGALEGTFTEANYRKISWLATPDPDAIAPDQFDHFEFSGRVDLSSLRFYDLEGKECSLGDARFSGDAVIVELMGTWCPNCHDASKVLMSLYEDYREQGLSVVALAFEMTNDLERNARFLKRYMKRNGVEYPVLLAWKDEPTQPRKIFPQVSGRFYFPTILFLHGDGTIEAMHTGFTGPATGQPFVDLQQEFRRRVESMLAAAP